MNRKPPPCDYTVPIPPLKNDEWHNMTVLPYLIDHYYENYNDAIYDEDGNLAESDEPQYFTERELNGNARLPNW